MLTPQEIQEQKFEKAVFGGYDMEQIDKFLDVVLTDYSSLYKENAALKAKMRVLVDKIEEYRTVEEELRKTLYNAQIAAKDTVSRAQTDAERILRDARATAAQNVNDLRIEIAQEERRLLEAKRVTAVYADKIRRAMALGVRQMEEILDDSRVEEDEALEAPVPPAPAPAAAPVHAAPRQEDQPTRVIPQPEPPQPEEPAHPSLGQRVRMPKDDGIAIEPEEPAQPARRGAPQSDTARIYGDSPFTPKPRFDFQDVRFGKQYAETEDDE